MRIFGSDRIASVMDKIGLEDGVPIEHGLVSKAIENAQKKVEAHNFDIRKHLLEYDDVMNQQREVVYEYRRQFLARSALRDTLFEFAEELSGDTVDLYVEDKSSPADWDKKVISEAVYKQFGIHMTDDEIAGAGDKSKLSSLILERSTAAYNDKVNVVGSEPFSEFEKTIMLHTVDNLWKDHLLSMDHLKGGIGLRGYGQKNPLQEYKKEGYELFVEMIGRLKSEVVERLFLVRIREEDGPVEPAPMPVPQKVTLGRGEEAPEQDKEKPVTRQGDKVGRNDPCPCGSGKKHKKCCGAK